MTSRETGKDPERIEKSPNMNGDYDSLLLD
jgi:hypothetical protein